MDGRTGWPTLADVAREVGVHPSTVSRAINPARADLVNTRTRAAVEEAVARLGYRPDMVARGLSGGRTATVGIVVPSLSNPFVTPIIHQVTSALELGMILPVVAETLDERGRLEAILGLLMRRRVDAIVTTAAREVDRDLWESAAQILPVVIAARPLRGSSILQVIHDDTLGGRLVGEHLASLGHTKVAQLRGPQDIASFSLRSQGFRSVCDEQGMREISVGDDGTSPTSGEGQRLMELVLKTEDVPTAVFAHNDPMAVGALQVLRRAGLSVPEEVSLVGYNDFPMMDMLSPPMTTVQYPAKEVGRLAGELVVSVLSDAEARSHCLAPTLVVRESTKALR